METKIWITRPGLGWLMGKFCQYLTGLSVFYMSISSFPDDNLSNVSGFSPNLLCALILMRSDLGLLFRQHNFLNSFTLDFAGILIV